MDIGRKKEDEVTTTTALPPLFLDFASELSSMEAIPLSLAPSALTPLTLSPLGLVLTRPTPSGPLCIS